MRILRPLAALALLVSFSMATYADREPEEILEAVVKVRATIPGNARTAELLGTERVGSGVIIDSKGHVLTIGYLILEAETIEVIGPDDQKAEGVFVAYDHDSGFGILRVRPAFSVTPAKLGESTYLKVGDPLLLASYGGPTSIQGVRVVSRQEFAGYWEYLLEDPVFTTPPHSGFGGAALIDRDGRLVGIGSLFTQVTIPGVGSIPSNMFVPIDRLKPIMDDLISTGRSSNPSKPWLGLFVVEAHGRVFVTRVVSDGPAERARLRPGDIILQVDDQAVTGLADLYRKVWALGRAGVDVPLSVLQGVRINEVVVHSGDRRKYLPPPAISPGGSGDEKGVKM
jgi:S1-C subfamily serine protease